jgi:hypothetical protein
VSYPPPNDPNQNPGYQQPSDQPAYYQQPSDQQPYYQQPPDQQAYYQQQPYYQQQYVPVQDHPQSTTALILGILGVVLCQVLGPVALFMGRKAMREIDASGGALGGRGNAQVGYILGIVGTILLGVGIVIGIIYLIVIIAVIGSAANSP